MTPQAIQAIAERIYNANKRRDYALAQHLLRPYPYGTAERKAIDAATRAIAAEVSQANPPTYFS